MMDLNAVCLAQSPHIVELTGGPWHTPLPPLLYSPSLAQLCILVQSQVELPSFPCACKVAQQRGRVWRRCWSCRHQMLLLLPLLADDLRTKQKVSE